MKYHREERDQSDIKIKVGGEEGGGAPFTGSFAGDFGAHSDPVLELVENLLADPADLHDLFDLLEAAVFLSVVEDSLGDRRADAGKRLEFLERGGVDVDLLISGFLSRLKRKERLKQKTERKAENERFNRHVFHDDLLSSHPYATAGPYPCEFLSCSY